MKILKKENFNQSVLDILVEDDLKNDLYQNGFIRLENTQTKAKFFKDFCKTVVPIRTTETKKNTLSSRFGLNEFPFHSDVAQANVPPKFLAIRFGGLQSSEVNFSILDFKDVIESTYFKKNCSDLIFSINTGRRTFIARLFKNDIFKYNPCIMKPLTKEATEIVEVIKVHSQNSVMFAPNENEILLINNHRLLHSRGAVDERIASARYIERIWIYEESL